MRSIRDIEVDLGPYTCDDPFWWCKACADLDHDDHVEVYVDPFGVEAGCECPTCG